MIFVVIYLIAGLFFGLMGAGLARERSRDAAVWFVICFLFPLLGFIALIVGGTPATIEHETVPDRSGSRRRRKGAAKEETLSEEDEAELARVKWLLSQGIVPTK